MPSIHLLEDHLINKIAAGEVVERPASVLKELIENAIDAGASAIDIELDQGGLERILVADNGSGMDEEDALLCLVRHATSKIEDIDDLFAIDTMGFRGEALASIASVSKLTILTRASMAKDGVKVTLVDDRGESEAWNGPKGTQVSVRELFYNVPARRQFLKKPSGEYALCLELVQAMALCFPQIAFHLVHNGKPELEWPGEDIDSQSVGHGEAALRARARRLYGKEIEQGMIYSRGEDSYAHMEVLSSAPGFEKSQMKHMHFFINNRWVKDQTLRYGILRAYHSHLLKGKYPIALVYAQMDPALLDVNVHPAKTEVRFQYPKETQFLLAKIIREQLRKGDWSASLEPAPEDPPAKPVSSPFRDVFPSAPKKGPSLGSPTPRRPMGKSPKISGLDLKPKPSPGETSLSGFQEKEEVLSFQGAADSPSSSQEANQELDWLGLSFIGSFAKGYLFFDAYDSLVVVDQHAFHERILYEKFSKSFAHMGASEHLILPEAIDLSPEEYALWQENESELRQVGLNFKLLNSKTLEWVGIPALLKNSNLDELTSELTHQMRNYQELSVTELGISHYLLSTFACHSAVRFGEELGEDDIESLIHEARGVDFFHNCPHGRRVFKRFKKSEVGRWFDR